MEAVQKTMEATKMLQDASDSLPHDEITKATEGGKRAQETAAMFTKQALGVKQVIEQYMMMDYQSHHNVVLADQDQGKAFDVAHKAEEQASTNSADIRVLQSSIRAAKEQVVQALKKSSKLGSTVTKLF